MTVEKVVAMIVRRQAARRDLLVFRHPHGGIQIPAGTVDRGEQREAAALREAYEETGLTDLRLVKSLGEEHLQLDDHTALAGQSLTLIRTDNGAPVELSRGWWLDVPDPQGDPAVVVYKEWNLEVEPRTVNWEASGRVPQSALEWDAWRSFFLLEARGETALQWDWQTMDDGGHIFTCFWTPLEFVNGEWKTPGVQIVVPQDKWLKYLQALDE